MVEKINSSEDEIYQEDDDLKNQEEEGDTPTPKDGEKTQEEEGEEKPKEKEKSEPIKVDWDSDDNPYKKRYGDSQSQVTPLVRTLMQFADYDHTTKSWKPKTQATEKQEETVEEINTILDTLDPQAKTIISKAFASQEAKFKKAISTELDNYKRQNSSKEEYSTSRNSAWNNTLKEFGSEMDFVKENKVNPDSPLYKLSNEILVNKYSIQQPDGTLSFTTPDAEYLSTVEAYAILVKREKNKTPSGKEKLGAVKGKTSKDRGTGELSEEEYLKLPKVEREKYQMKQMGLE